VLGGGRAHWEGGVRALLPTSQRFARLRTKLAFTFRLLLNFIDMPKL
jgi:hypothetical protein